MQKKVVSVIIPIYKVELYLEACVDRVFSQTYRNIEVILVDDGSPDRCPQICDSYAEKDSRVLVIHKENGGLSDARNAGIEVATGDYILFIDGDDYWSSNTVVEELLEIATETDADVINFGNTVFYDDSNEQVSAWLPETLHEYTVQNADEMTQYHAYISSACMKFMKAGLVKDNPRFESGKVSEDIVWSANLLIRANKYVSIRRPYYCYRHRHNSISKTLKAKSCVDLADAISTCVKIAEEAPASKKQALLRYASYQLGTFVIVQAIAEECPVECLNQMSNVAWILKYRERNRKMSILAAMVRIMGFNNTCRVVKLFKHS